MFLRKITLFFNIPNRWLGSMLIKQSSKQLVEPAYLPASAFLYSHYHLDLQHCLICNLFYVFPGSSSKDAKKEMMTSTLPLGEWIILIRVCSGAQDIVEELTSVIMTPLPGSSWKPGSESCSSGRGGIGIDLDWMLTSLSAPWPAPQVSHSLFTCFVVH